MLSIPFPQKVWLYRYPTDMRKSFDGLCGIVVNEMEQDPVSDGMFAFINRRRDRIKLLVWDRHGYWLLYKRLEQGGLHPPVQDIDGNVVPISIQDLAMVIEGVDLHSIKRKKRFTLSGT
jgi:transposase